MSEKLTDVVIVGAGIAGSAMAITLAKAGLGVTVLEKSLEHKDVVRGEWLAPWGVEHAKALGLADLYSAAGAHRPSRHIGYGDLLSPADAESRGLDFELMDIEKPLCLGHPTTCNVLNEHAQNLGVEVLRGVSSLQVKTGNPPIVRYVHDDVDYTVQPRWVIGADGRNGIVARQIGCASGHDEEHHLFSGMLVEGAQGWPEDLQVIGTEGDVNVLAFPQGEGRVRVYLGWPSEDRARLVGPQGPENFLRAWQLESIPDSHAIANATPISPCIAYPNFDSWVDSPVREGVVLIGDAAGRNDPIIGQGLSISHADVRMVSAAMLGDADWQTSLFDDYVTERKERMARLRTVARLTSLRESAFGKTGKQLRAEIHERLEQDENLAAPFSAGFVGPHALPAEVFADNFTQQIVGQPIWNPLP